MTKFSHYLAIATVFISSFALFQIQPLLGKYFLPRFGGGAAVWTTALFFFMSVLVVGYAYAVWLARSTRPVQQLVHIGVILSSLGLLWWYANMWPSPITPPITLLDSLSGPTAFIVVCLLTVCIALPYSVLAATSSLVQVWYGERTGREPIFLYAISNTGSLLGFLSYPFLVEPYLSLTAQGWWWAAWYVAFAGCMVLTTIILATRQAAPVVTVASADALPPARYGLWLGYTMVPVITLLLVTEHVTTQIAAVPLLWIIPLALYLASFSLSFYTANWYKFPLMRRLWLIAGLLLGVVVAQGLFAAWVAAGILFVAAALIFHYFHEQMVATRPTTEYLSRYYLTLSVAGLVGSGLVLLSRSLIPLPLEFSVLLTSILVIAIVTLVRDLPLFQDWLPPRFFTRIKWLSGFVIVLVVTLVVQNITLLVDGAVLHERNFYGYKRVSEGLIDNRPTRSLMHGRTLHGFALSGEMSPPTAYYVPSSGIGRMFTVASSTKPAGYHSAFVGLGTGGLAAYCRPQDSVRFYEIDPAVVEIAREYFPFLTSCPQAEVVVADGRQGLEREVGEGAAHYEYIVIDAYADDAVPMHLLTVEAFATYLLRLTDDGVIAVHISSRYLDLDSVMAGLSVHHGLTTRYVYDQTTDPLGADSIWVLFALNETAFSDPTFAEFPPVSTTTVLTWTDNYNAILPVIRW